MITVCLGLGSNQNDPVEQLGSALLALDALPEVRVVSVSHCYQSAPWGGVDAQPDFINAVALIETTLLPKALHTLLLTIEAAAGRLHAAPRNGPRVLDLDILLYGDQVIQTAALTVPHPRLPDRAFVLQPMFELMPGKILPCGTALSVRLAQCPPLRIKKLDVQLSWQ